MYPDTDHPPVKIERERVKKIASNLPTKPWELEEKYQAWGMPADVVERLPISKYVGLVDRLAEKLGEKHMKMVGTVLMQTMKALSRKGVDVEYQVWFAPQFIHASHGRRVHGDQLFRVPLRIGMGVDRLAGVQQHGFGLV